MSKFTICINGDDKAELTDAALELVQLLSGAPGTAAPKKTAAKKTAKKDTDETDEPPTPAKPKRAAAKKVTKDELRTAIQAAIKKFGEEPVKEVFAAHDAKKFSDFKTPKQFAAVMADIEKLEDIADELGEDDDDDLGV